MKAATVSQAGPPQGAPAAGSPEGQRPAPPGSRLSGQLWPGRPRHPRPCPAGLAAPPSGSRGTRSGGLALSLASGARKAPLPPPPHRPRQTRAPGRPPAGPPCSGPLAPASPQTSRGADTERAGGRAPPPGTRRPLAVPGAQGGMGVPAATARPRGPRLAPAVPAPSRGVGGGGTPFPPFPRHLGRGSPARKCPSAAKQPTPHRSRLPERHPHGAPSRAREACPAGPGAGGHSPLPQTPAPQGQGRPGTRGALAESQATAPHAPTPNPGLPGIARGRPTPPGPRPPRAAHPGAGTSGGAPRGLLRGCMI